MADAQQINDFLVDAFGRINKIEERAMTTGLGSAISITEIHIIEKIGLSEPARMSEIAHMLGVTLATMTVACDKLEGKGLVRRARSRSDRRVVQVTLTPRGRAVYEYHRAFHERMKIEAPYPVFHTFTQQALFDFAVARQHRHRKDRPTFYMSKC